MDLSHGGPGDEEGSPGSGLPGNLLWEQVCGTGGVGGWAPQPWAWAGSVRRHSCCAAPVQASWTPSFHLAP